MIRPFERIQAGEPISASEFNRAMGELERQNNVRVAAPLRYSDGGSGVQLDIAQNPQIWVRITGHETAGSGTVADLSKYSGIQQTDDPTVDGSFDLEGGLEFFADGLYLKEVNGRTDVPENAIVRAYQSDNGQYFTFIFEQAFDDSSGGVGGTTPEHIRIQGQFVKDDADQTACNGGPSPVCFYPGAIQKATCAGWMDDPDKILVWVMFAYNFDAVDNGPNPATIVKVDGTAVCIALPAGFSYTPFDAASELEVNGDSRPVYRSSDYARGFNINCDGTRPVLTQGGT